LTRNGTSASVATLLPAQMLLLTGRATLTKSPLANDPSRLAGDINRSSGDTVMPLSLPTVCSESVLF
jgi:hypothetical protein